ncbi:MAG: class I SAM-dependent methyltransferase [Desulfobacterales bacterium]|nr:class I SAM-dependent methyltransferase [Desulfobacterales bacterium]
MDHPRGRQHPLLVDLLTPDFNAMDTIGTMGQDIKQIERLYDTVAREYAEAFSGEHEKKPQDQVILKRFARLIGDRRPVWDLGCGPGQTTRYLHDLGIDIFGLDLSTRLLEEARRLHPGVHFRQGDMLALDFKDHTIAGAVAFYAIVHFSEGQVRQAFREVFRVLQPEGLFLLTYHIGGETLPVEEFLGRKVKIDFMFFSTQFIQAALATCGFEIRDVIEREPYPGVEYESRRGYVLAEKPRGRW